MPSLVAPLASRPAALPEDSYADRVLPVRPWNGVERRKSPRPDAPRRRASQQQGRALETLGHAVEYLMDSRMFLVGSGSHRAEQDAVQILMRNSRAVFQECPEVISFWSRMGKLCRASLERKPAGH